MISRAQWLMMQFGRRLWVRASLFALLAVVTALAAAQLDALMPAEIPYHIGANAVEQILNILASSMLAVTTFSLSTMVTAFGAATNTVTPRATTLLMEDTTAQNALSGFLGTFLYSIVGIVALKTGIYGERGRFVLFAVTIGVIALVTFLILRWIDHLSKLGRVSETSARVEAAATKAMSARRDAPNLGGLPLESLTPEVLSGARMVTSEAIGYVQHVDAEALASKAKHFEAKVIIFALPGAFVHPASPVAGLLYESTEPAADVRAEQLQAFQRCFTIGPERSFDQDPRFGMSVLSEIASRALSPAVNDPGTALGIIGRAVRILAIWANPEKKPEPVFPGLYAPSISVDDVFDDVFAPIARDGAAIAEIQIRLQKAFLALAQIGDQRYAAAALRHARQAMQRAEKALVLASEREQVAKIFAAIERETAPHPAD